MMNALREASFHDYMVKTMEDPVEAAAYTRGAGEVG
jgi:hypothetical protein